MPKHNQSDQARRRGRDRRLSVRSKRRPQPDVNRLARAVIALAIAQAEKEAAAEIERLDDLPKEPQP